ncbi:hypothetical protein [Candidatus Formimonas warabiya]|uniref:O-antigen ligase family protein n=1 Tax=Formimonas warabiya TaxID=1761012 RepID=A0A3G1KPY2_FORW1|nr:hypothetical protein [Candidatus Formimonas warabiya]ATW24496.1 hypothetical protein DCMF_06625 [Candidatus Formimonas warabiya]
MNIITTKKLKNFIVRMYLLIVLFLYTYSTGVNTGTIYSNRALIILYSGIGMYLLYSFIIKKNKFLRKVTQFDICIIIISYYVLFSSVMYSDAFSTSMNIFVMIILIYLLIKTLQFRTYYLGTDELINIYEFLFNTFIIFILISTIVAFLDNLNIFTLFPLPDITYYKRVQSWFSNSTMYGLNISIGIIFIYYNYCKSKNIIHLLLIFWFIYWLLMTGGRTPLIITIIGFIICLLFRVKKKSLYYLTSSIIGLVGSYYLFFDYLTRHFIIFRRFANGGIGSRDIKMHDVFTIWGQQNIIKQILGSGTNSLRDIFMYSAHSGFLRLWFDYGALFVLIYCIFIFLVIKKYIIVIRNADNKIKNLLIIGLAVTCMFLFAETMVIITISARYDFSLLLIMTALPYMYITSRNVSIVTKK